MINTLSDRNKALAFAAGRHLANGRPIATLLWLRLDRETTEIEFDPPTNNQILVKVDSEPAFFPVQVEEQSMLQVLESFPDFPGEVDLLCQFISAVVRSCALEQNANVVA